MKRPDTSSAVDRTPEPTVGDKKNEVALLPPPPTVDETPSSPAPSRSKSITAPSTPERKIPIRAIRRTTRAVVKCDRHEDNLGVKEECGASSAAAVTLPPNSSDVKKETGRGTSDEENGKDGKDKGDESSINKDLGGDSREMPPPRTPTRRQRRTPPRTKTPAKPRTPKGGLTALRLGLEDDSEEDGEKLTPSKNASGGPNRALEMTPTKRRAFGRKLGSISKPPVTIPPAVSRVYGLVAKATGSVGGNGSSGAIYGELTAGCMQKVVNVLKEETGFDEKSSFIDVGSGLGKPNFHVAQDPGCEISYGLELEEVRWQLSVVNHRRLLLDAGGSDGLELNKHNLFFAHGDVLSAKTFDPFTHVYMFDIGFPPGTLREIAMIFNRSQARHLISYQFPHKVEDYGFDVDMILKMPLRLTGSKEGHTMYLYRRKNVKPGLPIARITEVDPFFARGVDLCRNGGNGTELTKHVEARFVENTSGGIRTRRSKRLQAP